jgi:hypothetical protein
MGKFATCTVILWHLLKHTTRLCLYQLPLQLCGTFAKHTTWLKRDVFALFPGMTGFEGHSEKVSTFSQVVYMFCQMCHIIIMVPGKDIIERCTCFSKRQKIMVSCGNFSQYMHWKVGVHSFMDKVLV